MPPAPSQKGTGKKNAGVIGKRSRNTTPMSSLPSSTNIPPVDIIETEFLDLRLESVRGITYDDLVESSTSNVIIPDSKTLDGLITRLGKLNEIIERRGTWCDKGMRLVAAQRKSYQDDMTSASRRDDARREGDDDSEKKANKKKRKANDSLAPGDAHTGEYFFSSCLYLFFLVASTLHRYNVMWGASRNFVIFFHILSIY